MDVAHAHRLRAIAAEIEAIAEARRRAAVRATGPWTGTQRIRFDAERARRDGLLAHAADSCRRLAGQ